MKKARRSKGDSRTVHWSGHAGTPEGVAACLADQITLVDAALFSGLSADELDAVVRHGKPFSPETMLACPMVAECYRRWNNLALWVMTDLLLKDPPAASGALGRQWTVKNRRNVWALCLGCLQRLGNYHAMSAIARGLSSAITPGTSFSELIKQATDFFGGAEALAKPRAHTDAVTSSPYSQLFGTGEQTMLPAIGLELAVVEVGLNADPVSAGERFCGVLRVLAGADTAYGLHPDGAPDTAPGLAMHHATYAYAYEAPHGVEKQLQSRAKGKLKDKDVTLFRRTASLVLKVSTGSTAAAQPADGSEPPGGSSPAPPTVHTEAPSVPNARSPSSAFVLTAQGDHHHPGDSIPVPRDLSNRAVDWGSTIREVNHANLAVDAASLDIVSCSIKDYIVSFLTGKESTKPPTAFILLDVLRAVMAMHAHNLVHGAICPDNIVITKVDTGSPQAFLLSPRKPKEAANFKKLCKRLPPNGWRYLAPELMEKGKKVRRTFASDMWAFGCLVYYLAFMNHPGVDMKEDQFVDKMRSGVFAELFSPKPANVEMPIAFRNLFKPCVVPKPKSRPPAALLVPLAQTAVDSETRAGAQQALAVVSVPVWGDEVDVSTLLVDQSVIPEALWSVLEE